MGRKPTGNPTGRPPIKIDENQFKKLCAMHCTVDEIADFFDCHPDTVNHWCLRTFGESFSSMLKKFAAVGNISLRRYQFKMAERSVPMAIFLGKNWLGQTDRVEQTITEVEDLSPLVVMLSGVDAQDTDASSDIDGD